VRPRARVNVMGRVKVMVFVITRPMSMFRVMCLVVCGLGLDLGLVLGLHYNLGSE
jgi:hypothetical protein